MVLLVAKPTLNDCFKFMKLPDDDRLPTLTFHMEGLAEDSGDLELGVFVDKLKILKSALREVDRILHGAEAKVNGLMVSNLSHNSPAAVTLRSSLAIPGATTNDIFSYFSRTVSELSVRGGNVGNASVFLLEKVLELCNGHGSRFSRMWMSIGTKKVTAFDETTRESVLAALGRTVYAIGSVKGRVEAYNGHGDKKYLYVYPLLGGRVKCLFDDEIRLKAASAVERTVIVHGRLFYHEGEYFPYQVQVDTIDIPEESKATLESFIGAAPAATGDKSSVDFIKENRNEWH